MEEREGDFLIYAGIAIPCDRAAQLSADIEEVRSRAAVPREYRFKFNPGPENLDHREFIDLKEAVLKLATDNGVTLFAYAVLHDIAVDPDTARRNGINTVCFHFNSFLNVVKDSGLVLVDQFNDGGNQIAAHLRDKFSVGVTGMPYGKELRLSNILGFHYAAVGQSHFASLTDVVLGSLRFALNGFTRDVREQHDTCRTLLALLHPIFHRHASNSPVSEWGFQFSPKIIKAPKFRDQYEQLKVRLEEAGLPTEQPITGERQY